MRKVYNPKLGHMVILKEAGVSGVAKQFPKIPEDVFAKILEIDPEYNHTQNCGGCTIWMCKYINNMIKQSAQLGQPVSNDVLISEVYTFESLFKTLASIPNGISKLEKLKSMEEIDEFINNYYETARSKVSTKAIKESIKLGGVVIKETNNYIVLIPFTKASSQAFRQGDGANTLCVWCTAWAADNRWAYYMSMGNPLKIVFDKKTGKLYQHSNAKEEWAGFRDQHNNSADMKEIITDEDVINCLLNDDMNLYSKLADEVLKKFADSINDVDKQVLEMYKTQSFITIDEFGNEYEPEREYDDDDYEDEDEEPLDDYEYAISEVIGTTDEDELEKYTAFRTDEDDELINERLIKDLKRNPDIEWILQHNEEFHIVDIETLIADRTKAVDEYLEKITPEKIKEKCRKLKIDTWMRTKRGIKAELRKKLIGTQSRCIQRAIQENTGAPGINIDAFIKNYMNTHTREELMERDPYYKGEYDEFVVFKD